MTSFPPILACYLQGRIDKAVDEEVKKFLLNSCDVNADKVSSKAGPVSACLVNFSSKPSSALSLLLL